MTVVGDAKARKPDPRVEARKRRVAERERFRRAKIAERDYAIRLRQVAKQVGHIVSGFTAKDGLVSDGLAMMRAALDKYAVMITPWARAIGARMLADVAGRDAKAWQQHGETLGRALRLEVQSAPIGPLLQKRLADQVDLITSMPREAGQRVHEVAVKGLSAGHRADVVRRDILRTGLVTVNRATLIARTETSRTASSLTEVRAKHLGSEAYVWHTAGDADVREEHEALDGTVVRWDTPPIASADGTRAHAGQIYNCRCWAEPIIPDE